MEKSNMFPNLGALETDSRTLENDSRRIEESAESKESKIYATKKLAGFFEVEVTLKLFGKIVFSWHFPPIKND